MTSAGYEKVARELRAPTCTGSVNSRRLFCGREPLKRCDLRPLDDMGRDFGQLRTDKLSCPEQDIGESELRG